MRRRDLLTLALLAAAGPLAASAAEEKSSKKKKSGGDNYLPVDPLTGTTNKGGGRRGVLSVDCGLQIDDPKLREYADLSMPRLRAAYVQTVQIYAAGLAPGTEPNIDYLTLTLQRQTDQVLKKPGAKFLIGTVIVN
ncbi:hypothetical protein [Phenylobacterium sp.]|jgi:hypothetical protein|uniref:hypothetical protein n=1 Tax=Phenylobacterium sp. TaxID=1871053 RepID=UPI002F3E653F